MVMKKIFVLLFSLLVTVPVLAQCDCTDSTIINRLNNSSSTELDDLFEKLIDSASFSPSYKTESALADLIYEIKDEDEFQDAVKYYITNYCSVEGKQIICQ